MTNVPFIQQVRLAQLDRAFGYGPKGRGFESSNARWFLRGGNADKRAFPPFPFSFFEVKSVTNLVTLFSSFRLKDSAPVPHASHSRELSVPYLL